jgi:hypothetical protein
VSPAGDERHYVRAVEAAWSRLLGKPGVVSPREFEAIASWRRRGIPLAVVCEVIAAAGKRRSARPPRALTSLAHDVLEAWEVVAAGRTTPHPTDAGPSRSAALRAWQEAIARLPEGDRLHTLLSTLLAEEADGRAGEEIDARLDASLAATVSEETLTRVKVETASALLPFRDRMSDEEFQALFARAFADRMRSDLGLPRLSLSR